MTHLDFELFLVDLQHLIKMSGVRRNIDNIVKLKLNYHNNFTDEQRLYVSNYIKSCVQKEANQALDRNKGSGCVFMATGTGKSKVIIDRVADIICKNQNSRFILTVPTEKLRDVGWKDEFNKWGFLNEWQFIEPSCYASLHKIKNTEVHLILDEGHNLTDLSAEFFENNRVISCVVLTGTRPTTKYKIELFKRLGLNPVYEITLDEAVKLDIVAPYDITVVRVPLDNKKKNILGGTKAKPFMQTEVERYSYLSRLCMFSTNPYARINRMKFLYNIASKTIAAKLILEHIIPKEDRVLIFCGGKSQANELCEHRYYSKPQKPTKLKSGATAVKKLKYEEDLAKYQANITFYQGNTGYEAFCKEEINRLSCCEALNEGQNIDNLDWGLVAQLNSNSSDFGQRLGRIIRFRVGHTGKIIILVAEDTIDEEWLGKAILNLDRRCIKYITLEQLRLNRHLISIN
jgi:superfamily II DNA or RNA helicase